MSATARNWLPKQAFTEDAVRSALADLVARWSECWFARRTAAIATVGGKPERPLVPAAQSLQLRGVLVAAELSGHGKRHLLEAALDTDLSGQSPKEADHRVLDALATQIVEDLIARLDKAFGDGNVSEGSERIGVDLSISGNDGLVVTFPDHAIVPMLKAQLGPVRLKGGALRSRAEALKPTRLVAEGLLGRADLAVADLKGLAVGDVLILDRSLNEPVELRLVGSNRQIGRGRLVRNNDQVSIQF